MSLNLQLTRYAQLHLQLPLPQVLRRLGFRRRHNVLLPQQQQRLQQLVLEVEAAAAASGVAAVCVLRRHGDCELELLPSGQRLVSADLAKLVGNAEALALFAATVGPEPVLLRDAALAAEDGEAALIIDAAASELADNAIAAVQQLCRHRLQARGLTLDRRRFSPGYGDLDLSTQALLFDMLELNKLGLQLSERYQLIPEKSVTAVAAVRGSNPAQAANNAG